MCDDQKSSKIVWWSNILMFEALAKRFKHVLSNIVKHPNARSCGPQIYAEYHNDFSVTESAITHLACANQIWLIHLPKRAKHHQTNMRTKEMFDEVWSNVWWSSNSIKHHQTSSNKVAKRWNVWSPTMFDDVWSSNISRLVRALGMQRTFDFDDLHNFCNSAVL